MNTQTTPTTPREILESIRDMDHEINLMIQLKGQMAKDIGLKAHNTDTAGIQGNSISDPTAAAAIHLRAYEEKIDEKIDILIDLKKTIGETIDTIPDRTMRMLLTARYLLLLPWHKVADAVGYTERQVYRLHGPALQAFGEAWLKKQHAA